MRDNLLRRSEADLLEARETLRSRAVEVERQAAAVRGLEADVQRARREGQQREAECGSLRTQLMTLREELKEAQGRCRDTGRRRTQSWGVSWVTGVYTGGVVV